MVDVNGAPAVGGGSGKAGKKPSFIGVPKDYSVAPVLGDAFRPGGHQDYASAGPGLARQFTPTPQPHLPQYENGAEMAIANLSAENLARLQIRMAKAGLIGPQTKVRVGILDGPTKTAYKQLLGVANSYAVSDSDALTLLESNPVAKGSDVTGAGAASAGPTTSTQTSKSTTDITALDAEQVANQAYQDALGANASPKQRKALRAALQAYADAHPSISQTTSTTDPTTGHTDTTTSTSGGVDAGGLQQIAQDQAQAAPNYAEVQAGTTYFNALQQALGPTASVD